MRRPAPIAASTDSALVSPRQHAPVNISGVILRARPDRLGAVRNDLAAIPGVEIHAHDKDGRLVLTIEIEDGEECAPPDVFRKLHQLDGVLSASLVYQSCDDGLTQESKI